jgi:hypothetical protein
MCLVNLPITRMVAVFRKVYGHGFETLSRQHETRLLFQTASMKPVFFSSWIKLESTAFAGSNVFGARIAGLQGLEHELMPFMVLYGTRSW